MVGAMEALTIESADLFSPSLYTPLVTKGGGEGSTQGAPAVIANAVADALAPFNVEISTLPVSPMTIFEALNRARTKNYKMEEV